MSKGVRTPLTDGERTALAADYRAGLGINALRAKYCCGQGRVVAILEAAGVDRLTHPAAALAKRGVPRRDVAERSAGLGRWPSEEEWGYLAGIFDGEGYLGYASRGRHYRLTITQNAGRGLHERLLEVLGAGRVALSRADPERGVARFHLEAQRQVYQFCVGVLPHVMVKRPRVLEALASFAEKYGWQVPPER